MFNFNQGGPVMWLMLATSIAIVVVIVKAFTNLSKEELTWKDVKFLDIIPMLGFIGIASSYLFQMKGIFMAVEDIAKANDISPSIMMTGFAHSLLGPYTALIIFVIAALFWILLRLMYSRKPIN